MAVLYGIKNCDTVKKARNWLDSYGIAYAFHDFRSDGLSEALLTAWLSQVSWEILLNRSSTSFRQLAEQDKAGLTEIKAMALMLATPTLIKRPVLAIDDGRIVIGFNAKTNGYADYFPGLANTGG